MLWPISITTKPESGAADDIPFTTVTCALFIGLAAPAVAGYAPTRGKNANGEGWL